jgi:hypothetical protein
VSSSCALTCILTRENYAANHAMLCKNIY